MDIINSATKLCLLLIVTAIIVLNFIQVPVAEPLKSIALMVISFYFGQKSLGNNGTKE